MISLGTIQFASAWVLALLVLLPIWWLVRRKRRPPAMVFSRVGVLAAGPRAGRATTLVLFVLRNLLLASTIVAPMWNTAMCSLPHTSDVPASIASGLP